MQSHSNICYKLVLKLSLKNMRKGPQFAFVIQDHCQIFDIFFLILLSWLFKVNKEKNKVRFGGSWSGVEWRGVPVKRVVSGSLWVVLDGFYWLWVISDGFRCFVVLVVKRIRNIQKSYFFNIFKNAIWLTEVIRFFYLK